PLDKVIALSTESQIDTLAINTDILYTTDLDGNKYQTYIGTLNYVDLQNLGLNLTGIDYSYQQTGFDWMSLLIYAVPTIFIIIFLFYMFRRAQGVNNQAMGFGRSRARLFPANTPTVTFDDVAGVDEAKQELREVVEFLKSREKFQSLGARIPRGVLLVGSPGTGKTLLARAVAGEAAVPFFSISGSEFVEMFVGVGASRVRDLFDQAKHNAPCIIFIDEIDAVGRQRGSGLGGSHDEREQTLNQILVEMDGFDTNTSIIIMAATNRPDILDPALLRPGRFDRRVILDRPDVIGRTAILKVHSKGKPLAEDVKLDILAKQTVGFSGADLANLINEAAILAARRNKKVVSMLELEESIDKVMMGPERKSHRMSTKEKEVTAYHEAGHALVAHICSNVEPVRKISIIPRGAAGGYTKMLNEDKDYLTRSYLNDGLAMLFGGRVAEELIFNDITSGASSDIKKATDWARRMVTNLGMSEILGPRTFGQKEELIFLGREISEQKDYGEKVANTIDEEVNRIIQEAYTRAKTILTENKPKLVQIAERLLVKETIEGDELDALFNESVTDTKPEASAINTTIPPSPPAVSVEDKRKAKHSKKDVIISPPAEAPGTA
ncbi:MAG: ATP-dependent zinc metalloprotease FtsH, partial [Dehalococcoidales bacterium]|nr:ATP-dependent zinc metalloprotease FtsH [Dehalococcoidales bacterium]